MTTDQAIPGAVAGPKHTANGSSASRAHEELQYLNLVREILEDGEHRPDR